MNKRRNYRTHNATSNLVSSQAVNLECILDQYGIFEFCTINICRDTLLEDDALLVNNAEFDVCVSDVYGKYH